MKWLRLFLCIISLVIVLVDTVSVAAQFRFNQEKVKKLEPYKRIDKPARDEVSGLVKSKQIKDVFWVHGDSGTKPRIYRINANGKLVGDKKYKGHKLDGIRNNDWEGIAVDDQGKIIIADIGNNCKCREDLSLVFVEEPDLTEEKILKGTVYPIVYPVKEGLINRIIKTTPNAEAIFYLDTVYILTKEEGGRDTRLLKLQSPKENESNLLVEIEEFDFDSEVTGADISPDKKHLAVLTYRSVWVFPVDGTASFFDGDVRWLRFRANQVESIAFQDNETLIIAEESGDLYKIEL